MEYNPKASAAVAGMAAATAHANAMCARSATESAELCARFAVIYAAHERNSDLTSFVRELVAAGISLADLADWLGLMSRPSRGGVRPKDFILGQEHPGEAIVPATFNPWPVALAVSREILRLNTQIASLLQRWDGDGIPSQRA